MIALLNGNIVEVNGGEAVLDVNGVGYSVRVPATYMPKQRNGVKLYIDTVVREDSITLYGFESASEKEMLNSLELKKSYLRLENLMNESKSELFFSRGERDSAQFYEIKSLKINMELNKIEQVIKKYK